MPMTAPVLVKDSLLDEALRPTSFNLTRYGVTVRDISRNLSPALLYIEAIQRDVKCTIADTGALIAFSRDKTGRSPKDQRADYLNTRKRLYVVAALSVAKLPNTTARAASRRRSAS